MTSAKQLIRRFAVIAMLLPSIATAASTITYFHNDLAGSPIAASNSSGQVIWKEKYRPYGERIVNSPASGENEVWFTGRRQDADTGLVYMGARYYDPVVGRFLTKDPAGYDEGNVHSLNRYAYANNNPYRFVDRNGRAPTPFDLAFVVIDGARFLHAWATDGATRGAAIDLGISAGAMLIPIPGAALAIKAERTLEAGRAAERAASEGGLVIGKLDDVAKAEGWATGEYTLALPNKGSPRANWEQNSSRLREAMADGNPIRDTAVDADGMLRDNTGFLRAERQLLESRGWAYDRNTTSWLPPAD